jgi:uncharacterized membrane protein
MLYLSPIVSFSINIVVIFSIIGVASGILIKKASEMPDLNLSF